MIRPNWCPERVKEPRSDGKSEAIEHYSRQIEPSQFHVKNRNKKRGRWAMILAKSNRVTAEEKGDSISRKKSEQKETPLSHEPTILVESNWVIVEERGNSISRKISEWKESPGQRSHITNLEYLTIWHKILVSNVQHLQPDFT